jgi:type III secretion system YscQ/HrcQ family protein
MTAAQISPLAAVLDRMDAVDASRARILFCGPLARTLAAWVPGLSLAPRPAGLPAHGQEPEPEAPRRFGVLMRGRGAELRLQLPMAIDLVSGAILSAGAWSPAVQLNCLQARAASVLGDLVRYFAALGLQPTTLDAEPEPFVASPGTTLFECQWNSHQIAGCLRSTDAAWLSQLEAVITRLRPARWLPMGGLALPLRARLGMRRLSLRLLRSLQVGDVLLADGPGAAPTQARRAMVVVGSLRGRSAAGRLCTLHGHDITITGEHWMNTEALLPSAPGAHDAAPPAEGGGPGVDPLADIEVDVHFELEVLTTPVGELAAMRPGYVIELPTPATEATVSLVVGGQVVGRAQLVSIGDRLGARVLELFHADR